MIFNNGQQSLYAQSRFLYGKQVHDSRFRQPEHLIELTPSKRRLFTRTLKLDKVISDLACSTVSEFSLMSMLDNL